MDGDDKRYKWFAHVASGQLTKAEESASGLGKRYEADEVDELLGLWMSWMSCCKIYPCLYQADLYSKARGASWVRLIFFRQWFLILKHMPKGSIDSSWLCLHVGADLRQALLEVPGIGRVLAQILLRRFGSLEVWPGGAGPGNDDVPRFGTQRSQRAQKRCRYLG